MDVANKVVIVTGASSGIGEATAKLLSAKGAKVILVARSTDKLIELSKKLEGSLAIAADMSQPEAVRQMIAEAKEHFGRIDILINNAGQGYGSSVEKIDIEKYRQIIDLNVIGPLVAMQTAVPIMREQGAGMVVNISSGTSVMYIPNVGAYSSTKRALNGLSLTARAELAQDNIKVCVVHPYITATEFYKNTLKNEPGAGGHVQVTGDMPPMDTPEFVAEKILETIVSEEAEVFVHERMRPID
jgi:short-subunit dehydrogenase